ncbi:MAG TPA: hypothetical protein VID70_07235, partial [Solirubrobacteraceae bacterium]
MSAASSFDVPCGSCGAMNQALNAFCGMCGDSIKSANGIEQPRGERDHRYRGPRRLLILATTAIAIGAPAAIASFSA